MKQLSSFKGCFRLAVFYSLRDRLFGEPSSKYKAARTVVHTDGGSEFLRAIEGKEWSEVVPQVDELLGAVRVLQPQLYEAFLRRF